MRHETGSVELRDIVPSNWAREAASVQSDDAGPAVSSKAAIRSLFNSLEQKGVRMSLEKQHPPRRDACGCRRH
jgi:hypothetical protein